MKLIDFLSKPSRKTTLAGVSALSILSGCINPVRETLVEKNKPSLKQKIQETQKILETDLISYSDNFENNPSDENLRIVRKSICDLLEAFPESSALVEIPSISFYVCPSLREEVIKKLEERIGKRQSKSNEAGIYANLASLIKQKAAPLREDFAELVIPVMDEYEKKNGIKINRKAIPEKVNYSQAALAEEYFRKALSLSPVPENCSNYKFSLGELYREIGMRKMAQKSFIESAQTDAGINNSFRYYQIGKISSEIGELEVAEEWYSKAIKSEDANGRVLTPVIKSYYGLGEIFVKKGNLDKAEKIVAELTKLKIRGKMYDAFTFAEPVVSFLDSLVERGRQEEVKKYIDVATEFGNLSRDDTNWSLYRLSDKIFLYHIKSKPESLEEKVQKDLEMLKRHK